MPFTGFDHSEDVLFSDMGVAQKHSYRFNFLKSDRWKNFRLRVLVHYGEMCSACKKETHNLDIHHLWYPKRKEQPWDVRPMCRECHTEVHLKTSPGKYRSLEEAVQVFHGFLDGSANDGSRVIRTSEDLESEITIAWREAGRADSEAKHAEKMAARRERLGMKSGLHGTTEARRRDIQRNVDFIHRYCSGQLVSGKRDNNLLKWLEKQITADPDFINNVKEITGINLEPLTSEYIKALAAYRSSPV